MAIMPAIVVRAASGEAGNAGTGRKRAAHQGWRGRTKVLGEELLLYRTEIGEAVLMQLRCAHRSLALDYGRIEGDWWGINDGTKAGRCGLCPGLGRCKLDDTGH